MQRARQGRASLHPRRGLDTTQTCDRGSDVGGRDGAEELALGGGASRHLDGQALELRAQLGGVLVAAAAIVAQLARGDTVATGRRGARQVDWPRLLTDAVATSAAAVAMPVAGEIDPATRARLLPAVGIEQLSQR